MIQDYLDLLEKPGAFYAAVDDDVKRKLLKAYFSKIWIDDDDHRVESKAEPQSIVGQISEAARSGSSKKRITEFWLGDSFLSRKSAYSKAICLNKTSLVQPLHDRSSKSIITPPTPGEIARLAKKARTFQPNPRPTPTKKVPVRSLRRKLPPATISEIIRRYVAGEFTTHLSREYGISKSGLLGLLRAEGVKLRKQPITPEQERRAVQLYENGMTITEIVERIGSSYGSVRTSLHRSGVAMRIKGRKRSSLK